MLRKIISGGQTGADQAALDSAIKFNIEHGGWVPKGRMTEDGILSSKYLMDEMETDSYSARRRQNIIDSDATLIIAGCNLTGSSLLTRTLAIEMNKPYAHIDFINMDDFETAMLVHSFIVDNSVKILNVTGPRNSSGLSVYAGVRTIIESMIYMIELESGDGIVKIEFGKSGNKEKIHLKTIEDVLEMVIPELSLKTKAEIAALDESKIASLYYELSDLLMDKLVYNPNDTFLFQQYLNEHGNSISINDYIEPGFFIRAGDFVMSIVKKLKKSLEKDYLLRIVK